MEVKNHRSDTAGASGSRGPWIPAVLAFVVGQGALWVSVKLAVLCFAASALLAVWAWRAGKAPQRPAAAKPQPRTGRAPKAAPIVLLPRLSLKERLAGLGTRLVEALPETGSVSAWQFIWLPVLCLAAAQYALASGKTTPAWLALAMTLFLLLVFSRLRHGRYSIPRLRERGVGVLYSLLFAVPTVWGSIELWDYRHLQLNFLINAVGMAGMIWTLARTRWASLEDVEGVPGSDADYSLKPVWESVDRIVLSTQGRAAFLAAGLAAWLAGVNSASSGAMLSLCALGLFLFMAGLPILQRPLSDSILPEDALLRGSVRMGFFLLAVWLGWHGQLLFQANAFKVAGFYFLGGGILLSLAFPHPVDGLRHSAPLSGWEGKLEVAVYAALMALVVYLRWYHSGFFPYGIEGDEAGGGIIGLNILHGRTDNPFIMDNVALPFFAVTANIYKYFDVSVLTTRLHSIIFGSLSIAAFYFFARHFYGRAVALVSSVLMATGYWHLHYSRFGHYNIEQVMLQVPVFYCFFRAYRDGGIKWWALTGFGLGWAIQPHLASRLLPFIFLFFLAFAVAYDADRVKKRLHGTLALMFTAYLVAAPVLTYWARVIPLSMGRAKSVSVFDKTNTSAPRNTMQGIINNIEVSMRMFNVQGDSRPRNLLTAPRAALDPVTGVIFGLALVWAFLSWRDPLHAFLLIAFAVNLSAAVFSVEAPQALRSAGNIGIVYWVIASLLAAFKGSIDQLVSGLHERYSAVFKQRAAGLIFLALALPYAGLASYRSLHTYFVEFANVGYDALPTEIGLRAKHYGPSNRNIFYATGFASGHPPFTLFGWGTQINNYFELVQGTPLRDSGENDQSVTVYLCDSYMAALPLFKSLYPDGVFTDIKDPKGNLLFYEIHLTPEVLKRSHRIQAQVTRNGRTETVPLQGLDIKGTEPWLAGASRLSVDLALLVPNYGYWRFGMLGQGRASLSVDGKPVFHGGAGSEWSPPQEQAVGLHRAHLVWEPTGKGPFQLAWEGKPVHPNGYWNVPGVIRGAIDVSQVYPPETFGGLYGEVFPNRDLEGPPIVKRVDPMLIFHWLDSPIPSSLSMRWKGRLRITEAGDYRFQLPTCAFSEVIVNGQVLWRNGTRGGHWTPRPVLPVIHLAKGWANIVVDWGSSNCTEVDLSWAPPGQAMAIIPFDHMEPAL